MMLTRMQGFRAMYYFLRDFYHQTKSDDIAVFLSSLELCDAPQVTFFYLIFEAKFL